jgi:hypothetical protein
MHQERLELAPPPFVAADGQCAQRVAVIALPPCDEHAALRLADLDGVLARQLQRGLDCLGTARDEVDVLEARRRSRHERVGERFGDVGREEARMRVGDATHLRVDRREHVRMRVAQARYGGAATRVEIALAIRIDDLYARRRRDDGRHGAQIPMHQSGHRDFPGPPSPACQ